MTPSSVHPMEMWWWMGVEWGQWPPTLVTLATLWWDSQPEPARTLLIPPGPAVDQLAIVSAISYQIPIEGIIDLPFMSCFAPIF